MTLEGKADDAGGGTIIGPRYGVWYENTNFFQWLGGNIVSGVTGSEYYVGSGSGGNYRAMIYDVERGMFTLPLARPATGLPVPDGSAYFDTSANRLYVKNGTNVWKSVLLS